MKYVVELLHSERSTRLMLLLFGVILATAFGVLYFYVIDFFRPPPHVDIFAENRFERTINVVADNDYAPYSYIDESGAYTGYDVELMNELANRLQVNLNLRLVDRAEAYRAYRSGDADIMMNTDADIVVNNNEMIATLPVTEKQYVVYGKNGISSVADLYGRRVASQHHMPGLGLDDEITYVDSYEEIFKGLKSGEYEFVICPIQVGNYFLEKLGMDDVQSSYAVMHVYSALALHRKDTPCCGKCNRKDASAISIKNG